MKKFFPFIIILPLFLLTSVSYGQNRDSLDLYIQSQMQQRRIPGLQLSVIRNGKIIKSAEYGLANIQDSVPVRAKTVFALNSITKAFTGVAIMQLVEEGKLDLDAPVSRYLDSLPQPWQSIPVRRLLTHTSGLPDILGENKSVRQGEEKAAWAAIQKQPIEFAPGQKFKYNQTNYLLLGKIIAKISGQGYAQFIKKRQFEIVGMPLTTFGDAHTVIANSSRGYTYFQNDENGNTVTGNTLSNVFEEFVPYLWPAAGLWSTAEEVSNWITDLQAGKLLKDKNSITTLWTYGLLNNGSPAGFSKFTGYALGFMPTLRTDHPAISAIGGGRSAVFIYPNDSLSIVILTNMKPCLPEEFIDEVAGYYIPGMKVKNGFGLPPPVKVLRTELIKTNFSNSGKVYKALKKKDRSFTLAEDDVNSWGYLLLRQGEMAKALEVFRLNIALYPSSGNVYDSYGETLLANGQNKEAAKMYKKAVELNPKNENAKKILKQISTD